MKYLTRLHSTLIMFALAAMMMQCKEDEKTPSPPQVSSELSTLSVKFGDSKSFSLTISAAGKIKEVTASADKGTVSVSDITGVDEATGTAKINYTAPFQAGAGKITIVVKDQSDQQISTDVTLDITEQPPVELTAGDVEGVWGPSRTYVVRGNLRVAAGKSLTVKEGVTVIIEGDGTQLNSPGFVVEGNFYSLGTADKPVLFTVADAKRKKENIFAGLWGGILATATSNEMVIVYTRLEYAGAPAVAGTPIVTSGELKEGDPRFSLYFNNPTGKFIMQNSTIAYTKDDGMRINQGQLLVTNNTYLLTGQSGGEGLNIKSGAVGDVAYNTFISCATNAVKWSNSDDRTPQNDVNVYNNTAINSGWRQTKAGRGGSFNLEKGGRGKAYNNMAINCRYGTRFPKSPDNPDLANSTTGYNLYFANNDEAVAGFYPSTGSIVKGNFDTGKDVSGGKNEFNPQFTNWDVTVFNVDAAKNAANADFIPLFEIKLKSDSPALTHGKTDFTTKFTSHSVGGITYTVPVPSNFIGAKGN